MTDRKPAATLVVELDAKLLAALDAWIDRSDAHPSREEAVRQVLAGRLGSDRPSTILPGFTTGRDIV
jgi:metal-responsive CopG/Arc/MetJ family transcriptional regulator